MGKNSIKCLRCGDELEINDVIGLWDIHCACMEHLPLLSRRGYNDLCRITPPELELEEFVEIGDKMRIVFECKKCGCRHLRVIEKNVDIIMDVDGVDELGGIIYDPKHMDVVDDNKPFPDGLVFVCEDCEEAIYEGTPDGFVDYLREHDMLAGETTWKQ